MNTWGLYRLCAVSGGIAITMFLGACNDDASPSPIGDGGSDSAVARDGQGADTEVAVDAASVDSADATTSADSATNDSTTSDAGSNGDGEAAILDGSSADATREGAADTGLDGAIADGGDATTLGDAASGDANGSEGGSNTDAKGSDSSVADAPIGQDAPIDFDTAQIDAGFPVACLGNVSIDFATLAPYWVDVSTACGAASFASNALILTRRGACSSVAAGGWVKLDPARWQLCGDFDVRVNFNLLDFTVPVGGSQVRYATIRASDPSGSDGITIERYDLPVGNNACGYAPSTETYKAWTTDSKECDGSTTFVATSDMTGAFRLTRTGATVTSYYLSGVDGGSGGSWVAVKSDTSMTTTPWTLGFDLGYDDGPDATDMSVAFSSLDVVSASAP